MEKNNTNSDGFLLQRQLVIQRSMQYNLFSDTFLSVYIPTGVHHLHGVLEPASRKVRTTFTETEPMQI